MARAKTNEDADAIRRLYYVAMTRARHALHLIVRPLDRLTHSSELLASVVGQRLRATTDYADAEYHLMQEESK